MSLPFSVALHLVLNCETEKLRNEKKKIEPGCCTFRQKIRPQREWEALYNVFGLSIGIGLRLLSWSRQVLVWLCVDHYQSAVWVSDCTHICVIVCMCFVSACIVREDVLQQQDYCSYLPSYSSFLPLPTFWVWAANRDRLLHAVFGNGLWSQRWQWLVWWKIRPGCYEKPTKPAPGVILCSAMSQYTATHLTNPLKMTNVLINCYPKLATAAWCSWSSVPAPVHLLAFATDGTTIY